MQRHLLLILSAKIKIKDVLDLSLPIWRNGAKNEENKNPLGGDTAKVI